MNTPNQIAMSLAHSEKHSLADQHIEQPLPPLRAVAVMVGGASVIAAVWYSIIWIARMLWPF